MTQSKQDALAEIKKGLAAAEKAIRNHPSETVALYEAASAAFKKGQDGVPVAEATKCASAVGLSVDEFKLVRLYLFSMAFIAAWYHSHGDKQRRDAAAQSASFLAGAVGFDVDHAFREILDHEGAFRVLFEPKGVGRNAGCSALVLFATLTAGAVMLLGY